MFCRRERHRGVCSRLCLCLCRRLCLCRPSRTFSERDNIPLPQSSWGLQHHQETATLWHGSAVSLRLSGGHTRTAASTVGTVRSSTVPRSSHAPCMAKHESPPHLHQCNSMRLCKNTRIKVLCPLPPDTPGKDLGTLTARREKTVPPITHARGYTHDLTPICKFHHVIVSLQINVCGRTGAISACGPVSPECNVTQSDSKQISQSHRASHPFATHLRYSFDKRQLIPPHTRVPLP